MHDYDLAKIVWDLCPVFGWSIEQELYELSAAYSKLREAQINQAFKYKEQICLDNKFDVIKKLEALIVVFVPNLKFG